MAAHPRSLADSLREFSDEQLQRLLSAREDLLVPLPQGIGSLAARAATPASTQKALTRLNRPELMLVETLAVLPDGARSDAVAAAAGAQPATIAPTLEHLRCLGLMWGGDDLHLVRSLREGLRHPAGLAPTMDGDPDLATAAELVAHAREQGPELAEALEHLAWGPARLETTGSALADDLVSAGIAVPAGQGVLRLPRSVHLALRGGSVHRSFPTSGPRLEGRPARERIPGSRTAGAVDAAFEALRVARTIEEWSADPPGVLTRGGLPQRELRRLAENADTSVAEYVTVIQAAWSAGMLGHDGMQWRPTREWDEFEAGSPFAQWAELTLAWARSEDLPSAVGTSDGEGPARAALSTATRRPGCRARRRSLLRLLCSVPDVQADPGSLASALAWEHPLVPPAVLEEEVSAFGREAAVFGLVQDAVITALGSELAAVIDADVAAADRRLAEALEEAAPEPVDEVLLDADLTAVIPGRPSARLEELQHWTEVVSRGGALTLRFTAQSVRRALDAGRDPDELAETLHDASRTPVPQTLEYLVRDERRRHGQVRVRRATSVLSAEEGVLSIVEAHPEAAALRLQRIAPTVAVTSAGPAEVMRTIERTGMSGVAVGPDGATASPAMRRASGGIRTGDDAGAAVGPELALSPREAVARIREADAGESPLSVTDRLLDAIAHRSALRIGIVDGRGGVLVTEVEPLSLEGGRLRAIDVAGREEFTVLVHRVTLG